MPHPKEIFVKRLPASCNSEESPQTFSLLPQGYITNFRSYQTRYRGPFLDSEEVVKNTQGRNTHTNESRPLGGKTGKRQQNFQRLLGMGMGLRRLWTLQGSFFCSLNSS